MPDILNDLEKAAVQMFYEHVTMREAVKKVLLKQIYDNGTLKPGVPADPLKNMALVFVSQAPGATDEQVGRKVRAIYEGINAIEVGFGELANYKKEPEPEEKPKTNKAR
jgi:hypothetical protein